MNRPFVRAGRAFGVLFGVTLAACFPLASSDAQSLRVTRSSLLSDAQEGLGNVHGGEVQLLLPINASRVSARMSVSYGRGEIDRLFIAFAAPLDQAYVQLTDRSLALVGFGIGGDLARTPRVQAQISTDILFGRTRLSDNFSTGRDTRGVRGARISMDGTWWMTARAPLGVHAAGSMGLLKPTGTNACIGCASALDDKTFRASRVAVGIALRRPAR